MKFDDLAIILIGFGAVHQHFARIVLAKGELIAERYGLNLVVVGAADSGGAIYQASGLDLAGLLDHKLTGNSVHLFPDGEPSTDALALAQTTSYKMLLEASPVNLHDGEPAVGCIRAALERGCVAILANKAPLVLDYTGLHKLAGAHDTALAFSATVCGGLPVINVGQRDLVGATIHRIEGIFNSTTNYILSQMTAGETFENALAEAQRRGVAETDPTLDVAGWDTANKLVIIANAVLGYPADLDSVRIDGILELSRTDLQRAKELGQIYKLIATAERQGASYRLLVRPRAIPADSFLGSISEWQMGITFYTDIYEDIYLKIDEREPTATAAAMLRDCLTLATRQREFSLPSPTS